jgi:hypothetical protein
MAKMKLYYSPGSPYARKARIVAMETKLDKKMEMVNVAVAHRAQRRRREAQSHRQHLLRRCPAQASIRLCRITFSRRRGLPYCGCLGAHSQTWRTSFGRSASSSADNCFGGRAEVGQVQVVFPRDR